MASGATLFALALCAAPGALAGEPEASSRQTPRIGKVTLLEGNATAEAPEHHGTQRRLELNANLYERETVRTLSNGRIQITLDDATVIQAGPKAKLTLDEYLNQPGSVDSKCKVSVAEGVLRFVGGATAKLSPNNVQIKTPSATIGVRGTISRLKASATETAQYCEEGVTAVENSFGVAETKAGFAAITKAGQAPGAAFKADAAFIASLDPLAVPLESAGMLPKLYLAGSALCAIRAIQCRRRARHHPRRFVWWFIALVLLGLGLNGMFSIIDNL